MKKIATLFCDSPARNLLVIAAILQLAVVLGLFTLGRMGVVPDKIDDHGLLRLVLRDARDYDRDAGKSVEILKQSGLHAWLGSYEAHVKLYSLCYLVFGPLLGHNILSVEPLNLGCYLGILILVFKIGKELFGQVAARAAAAAVAVWPSFLVHNAQILKDPLCIVAMLSLVLVAVMWLTRELSWRMGLLSGLLGGTAIGLIYATRAGFWGLVMLGLIVIGAAFLMFRTIRERSFWVGNMLSMFVVLLLAIAGVFLNGVLFKPQDHVARPPEVKNLAPANQNSAVVVQPDNGPKGLSDASSPKRNRLVTMIQVVRDSFAYKYRDSATLIDDDVQFITTLDLIRYLPRAMEIGFLAPFPNAWLSKGKEVGLAGRLVSGLEMLTAYALEILAVFGVWRARQRLSTWYLFSVVLFGVTALGFGLINVGTLYRMRYGFFILLIVLGTYGLSQIWPSIGGRSMAEESRLT